MARHVLPVMLVLAALAAGGCVINATAPITANTDINANTQVQANTQVDQRQGSFPAGSAASQGGPVTQVQAGQLGTTSNSSPLSASTTVSKPSHWSDNLLFASVKSVATGRFIVSVIDFDTVIVAAGKTLHVTIDAGRTWKEHLLPVDNDIMCMSWLSKEAGWIGGFNGMLLKAELTSSEVSIEPIDVGASYPVSDVLFADPNVGFIRSAWDIKVTQDGGQSWANVLQNKDPYYRLAKDKEGGVFLGRIATPSTSPMSAPVYRYSQGGFTAVTPGGLQVVENPAQAESRLYFRSVEGQNVFWAWTEDNVTSNNLGSTYKTPTKFIRTPITRLFPLNDNQLIGQLSWENQYIFSDDGGKSWTEPKKLANDFVGLKSFGGNKMWAWTEHQLFRSGI